VWPGRNSGKERFGVTLLWVKILGYRLECPALKRMENKVRFVVVDKITSPALNFPEARPRLASPRLASLCLAREREQEEPNGRGPPWEVAS